MINHMKSEKTQGLIVNIAIYLFAFSAGFIPYYYASDLIGSVWSMFIFTTVASLIMYVFCVLFKNTSIYDPYWSVAPLVMTLLHIFRFGTFNFNSLLFSILVFIYAFRLTRNWYLTYKGLDPKHEDWRYQKYRQSLSPIKFQIVNFFGLIFIPTYVVFAAFLPGIYFMNLSEMTYLSFIGLTLMLLGPVLEFIADHQVHKFIKENYDRSKVCNIGLWKYSRHPNYLGELTFWLGIALTFLFSNISRWYFALGFIPMLLLFLFISIPLMEKHNLEKRPEYAEYKRHTSMLLILPRRK